MPTANKLPSKYISPKNEEHRYDDPGPEMFNSTQRR
jgi:hypothetical protein